MTRERFVVEASRASRASSALSGLPAGVTVAQAALESGWGRSELSRVANNYFGIKAHGKHASVLMPTVEVIAGERKKLNAKFARYENIDQCFEDRDRLIRSSAFYAEACAKAGDPQSFIRALAHHWATDPAYGEKLLRVYHENGFHTLDLEGETGTPML